MPPTTAKGQKGIDMETTQKFTDTQLGAYLADMPWLCPQGEPLPEWRVFDTRIDAYAALRAEAERRIAGVAQCDDDVTALCAHWRSLIAVRGNGAPHENWSHMLFHGYNAVCHTWGDGAGIIAFDAAHIAVDYIYAQEGVDAESASARLAVWEQGYGLLCDLDGVLYVYRREE